MIKRKLRALINQRKVKLTIAKNKAAFEKSWWFLEYKNRDI